MKVVKILLGGIVGIVVLLFIGSFFISSNFRVSDTQTLKASPEAVYHELTTAAEWKNWSYWNSLDPDMPVTYSGPESGVGSSYSWKSEKKELGSGTSTVEYVIPNEYVKINLVFEGQGGGQAEYIIRSKDGGSEVTSAFNSETKNFFEKWMSRLMGKPMMKKAFKSTMESLDKYVAEHPVAPAPAPATDSASASITAPADSIADNTATQ